MFERYTDRARRVVVLAQDEARMLNHNWVGTEHLLLGLIGEGDGVAGDDSRPGRRARARRLDDALAAFDALDSRLAAIERWVGMRPDLEELGSCPIRWTGNSLRRGACGTAYPTTT